MEHLEFEPDWPVMFLDLDGVFNGNFYIHSLPYPKLVGGQFVACETTQASTIDFQIYERFIDIIEPIKEELQIVIISSWFESNLGYGAFINKCPWLRLFHTRVKHNIFLHNVVGTSTCNSGGTGRGKAIREIVDNFNLTQPIIIDDSHDTFMGAHPPYKVNIDTIMPNENYGMEGKDFNHLFHWVNMVKETMNAEANS